MRDSFLVFYDSPRDSVGQSNMKFARDQVNTRVIITTSRIYACV